MNNFAEQDRIEQFRKTMAYCMPGRFHPEFVDMLRDMTFFTAPLPFTTTGHIQGHYSITVWQLPTPYYHSRNALN